MNVLEINNLELHFFTEKGAVRAVDDVSFYLKKGESLGLVGESGCGKTTTAFAVMNMPPPPGKIIGGEIKIDGEDIVPLTESEMRKRIRWQKVSMIFQGAMNCLTPVYTIEKQMAESIQCHSEMDKTEVTERINHYLNMVGLEPDITKRYPHELSGGMKQRVVIATALLLEPSIVICDEPTTALDVIVQAQIMNLLKDLKKKLGISYIFITHDLAIEAEVADRIAVMYAGKIVEIGSGKDIYGGGALHPYTQKLIGATPRLHKKVQELDFIPGVPPDLISPLPGCGFHPRCTKTGKICKEKVPSLIEANKGHFVACHKVV